jgi:hypothetical protein
MIHRKLVQLVHDHVERIATRAIQSIHQDECLISVRRLPEWELRDWAKLVLRSLVDWPVQADDHELSECYETLGKQRFQDSIPLHEAIRRMHHLKWAVVNWVRDQGFPQSSVDLYALEEFEHHVNLFFDHLVFYIARGYEEARQDAHVSA